MGSALFEMALPVVFGYIIRIEKMEVKNPNEHDEYKYCFYGLLGGCGLSFLCEWIYSHIYSVSGHLMACQMRYDFYYNFRLKCLQRS